MSRLLIGGSPPTKFLKMRQNRADAADRARELLMRNAPTLLEQLRRAGVEVVGAVAMGEDPALPDDGEATARKKAH